MVWDDTKDSNSELDSTEWNNHVSDQKSRVQSPATFVGQFEITGATSISVTAPSFQPSSIKFDIHANGGKNVSTVGGSGSNVSNSASNATGFARNDGTRQCAGNSASGDSINEVRRFSTNSNAILLEYSGQDGGNVGTLRADVTSFDTDGFTVDVTSYQQNEVIIYTAYR